MEIPRFSDTRRRGYMYGRAAVDDKDNLAACLMITLMLKRLNVPLHRDVIFGTTEIGIDLMVGHFAKTEPQAAAYGVRSTHFEHFATLSHLKGPSGTTDC